MDHRPQNWGRPRDDVYGAYDPSHLSAHFTPTFQHGPTQATQAPVVTGTSVIALKFRDGVIMAADNLASYGSLARFNDVKRLRPVLGNSVIGFSGDVSDMQYIDRHLNELEILEDYTGGLSAPKADEEDDEDEDDEDEDEEEDDEEDDDDEDDEDDDNKPTKKPTLNAANLHKYMSKLFYARRNKFDPLWNQVLVAGFSSPNSEAAASSTATDETTKTPKRGKPFLAAADLRGTVFSAAALGTGYGAALALPIMRKYAATEEDAAKLTRKQAMDIIKECMKVLYYRDARSWDTYSWAVVTHSGVEIKYDEKLEGQSWAFAERIKGYGTQNV